MYPQRFRGVAGRGLGPTEDRRQAKVGQLAVSKPIMSKDGGGEEKNKGLWGERRKKIHSREGKRGTGSWSSLNEQFKG